MTKEEGLSLGETAHPLKSRELRPPVASAAGNRATNKLNYLRLEIKYGQQNSKYGL